VTGTGQRHRIIKLKPIVQALGRTKIEALPGLHALSSADITGSFAGKGKVTWWKIFKEADEESVAALAIIDTRDQLSEETLAIIEKLVCKVYVPATTIASVKELRWWLLRKKQAQSENLPPTQEALRQAIKRAQFQAMVWELDTVPEPQYPSQEAFGWKLEDAKWHPVMTTLPPAPEAITELVKCGCSKSRCTTNRCNCRKASLNCTDLCSCCDGDEPCENQLEGEVEEDEEEDEEDADYESEESDTD